MEVGKSLRLPEIWLWLRAQGKKLRNLVLFASFVVTSVFASTLPFQQEVNIKDGRLYVHGRPVKTDVPPVRSGRDIFVPVRFVAESLKAKVTFLPEQKAVEVVRGNQKLLFIVGKVYCLKNGKRLDIGRSVFIYRGRTMIPYKLTRREMAIPREDKKRPEKPGYWNWPEGSLWERVVYVVRQEPAKPGNKFVAKLFALLWALGIVVFIFQGLPRRSSKS